MTFSGWVATLAGWYVTEIGRQPWLVTGVLTTADAVGPVAGSHVAFTLAVYLVLYAVLLVAYIGVLVHLARKAGEGWRHLAAARRARPAARPARAEGGLTP